MGGLDIMTALPTDKPDYTTNRWLAGAYRLMNLEIIAYVTLISEAFLMVTRDWVEGQSRAKIVGYEARV